MSLSSQSKDAYIALDCSLIQQASTEPKRHYPAIQGRPRLHLRLYSVTLSGLHAPPILAHIPL